MGGLPARLGIVGAAALWPGAAIAAGDGAIASGAGLAAIFAFLAAVGAGVALRERARARRLAANHAVAAAALADTATLLAAAPAALCRWDHAGEESFAAGSLVLLSDLARPRLADLMAQVEAADGAALEAAVARLRRDGSSFELPLRLRAGRGVLDALGRRIPAAAGVPAADMVWFLDGSSRAVLGKELDAARQEQSRLRAVLDALPLPVWRRAPDLGLADCNRAHAVAVDAPRQKVLE